MYSVAFVVLLTAANVEYALGGVCRLDWHLKNGHCYRMFEEAVTMSEAKAKCAEENSNPVSIGSKEEYTFIYTLFGGKDFMYIGLTYTDNGSWKWFDGSSLSSEPVSDEPIWLPGYPKNESRKRCVMISESIRSWKNVNCNMKHYFMCEYDSTNNTTMMMIMTSTTEDDEDTTTSKVGQTAAIAGGIAGLLLIIALIAVACIVRKRRKAGEQEDQTIKEKQNNFHAPKVEELYAEPMKKENHFGVGNTEMKNDQNGTKKEEPLTEEDKEQLYAKQTKEVIQEDMDGAITLIDNDVYHQIEDTPVEKTEEPLSEEEKEKLYTKPVKETMQLH